MAEGVQYGKGHEDEQTGTEEVAEDNALSKLEAAKARLAEVTGK